MIFAVIFTGSALSLPIAFASPNDFARALYAGMRGEDVRALQRFLNTDAETRIADAGAGSPGNETDYFGPATKDALVKFQEKYRAEILVPVRLRSGTGFFGVKTREKVNALLKVAVLETVLQSANQIDPALSAENTHAPAKQDQPSLAADTEGSAAPLRLKIPGINVDAPVIYVGLTADGAMDVPKGPSEVAWFNLGPRPGGQGSSVISGHFGTWKDGEGSVFDNLNKLKKGDTVSVLDGRGAVITFAVRELRTYDNPNADASDVFSSNDGKAHLNLITCGGDWDRLQKAYPHRLVVFTDKVE